MAAYYNENDKYAAAWLRNLIAAGHIAPGDVDERDIRDVKPVDLLGYDQCHFFAGVGGWSYALRLAGWPDDRPVWTGSCPCQPFSAAGGRAGFADERHLWPAFFHLIEIYRPDAIFGEQVASKHGLAWLDLVHADLEAAGYAVGAVDLCAAGVGAPHIRQRLWFVADASSERTVFTRETEPCSDGSYFGILRPHGAAGSKLGYPEHARLQEQRGHAGVLQETGRAVTRQASVGAGAPVGGLADTECGRRQEPDLSVRPARQEQTALIERRTSFWSAADWIPCTDGKARSVEPGTFPLAHGAPARVGRLRAYGNAIVPQVAAEFIHAYRIASLNDFYVNEMNL